MTQRSGMANRNASAAAAARNRTGCRRLQAVVGQRLNTKTVRYSVVGRSEEESSPAPTMTSGSAESDGAPH